MDTGWTAGGKVGYDFAVRESSWKACTITTPAALL